MNRYLIDPPEGDRYGFPRLFVGDQRFLDTEAWLEVHGYPDQLREQCSGGVGCRLVDLGRLAGCAISQVDVDLVDEVVPGGSGAEDVGATRSTGADRDRGLDTVIASGLADPTEQDLARLVSAFGVGQVYARLLKLAGIGALAPRQTARAALLLSCIVCDLAHGAGLSIPALETPWAHSVEGRRRVSGAGLRTYLNVCRELAVSAGARIAIVGQPTQGDFDAWCAAAHAQIEFVLPEGALLGISAMLGVYAALKQLYGEPDIMAAWVGTEAPEPPFSGRPIDFMERGLDEMLATRRWLEAELEGASF